MKSLSAVLLAVATCLLAVQCQATTLPASCGDDGVKLDVTTEKAQPIPAPSANNAVLIFVQRNTRCIGCSVTRVGVDGAWAGADKGNSYFAIAVAPGEHHVCANWEAPLAAIENKIGLTDLQAVAGNTYYFEIEVAMRGPEEVPRMRLKPISSDMGAFLVSRSKQSIQKTKAR